MSRQKARSSRKPQTELTTAVNKTSALIIAVTITLIVGGIPFLLGKYIELNSPDPFDGGAYAYSAQHLLQGARLGTEEVASAYPGTLIVNIIGVRLFGFSDFGPKIVQGILQLAAFVFMFYTMRKLFGWTAAVVGTCTAAIYLSAPLIAKFGNVKEQHMIAFMIFSVCCFILYELGGKRSKLFLCGFFAIIPYYFKPTGLSIIIAIVAYLLVSRILSRSWRKLFLEFAIFICGNAVGLLVPASLYIWQGQLGRFMKGLPVLAIEFAAGVLIIGAAVYYLIMYCRRIHIVSQLRNVNRRIYKFAIIAIIASLLLGIITVAAANLYFNSKYPSASVLNDISGYLLSLPFIKLPLRLTYFVRNIFWELYIAAGLKEGYAAQSWKAVTLNQIAPKILRYYKALAVPILLAFASIIIGAFAVILKRKSKQPYELQNQIIWLLAGWWAIDMAFVWVSPHSYEQYYLPLCASAAILGGYCVWQWSRQLAQASFKMPWIIAGALSIIILGSLAVPIFIGQRYSPDTGSDYMSMYGKRFRGFSDALDRVNADQDAAWQQLGKYIRANSSPQDKIYVWGWVPGIYVEAQRMAPIPQAFEANMHVTAPDRLVYSILNMVNSLKKSPPKFIVDTRKQHFPFDRPPLELWPTVPPKRFGNKEPRPLNAADANEIESFNVTYKQILAQKFGADEAKRYDAMQPFREFVMTQYKPVANFGAHVLFELK